MRDIPLPRFSSDLDPFLHEIQRLLIPFAIHRAPRARHIDRVGSPGAGTHAADSDDGDQESTSSR